MGARVVGATDPVVRPFADGDRNAVIGFLAGSEPWVRLGYTASDWERIFSASRAEVEAWVIEAEGAVAGVAIVRRNFLAGDYLELFAIAPAARGKGLGASLLAELERRVFDRTKNFFVCVSDFNRSARRFYERSGYREIGPISDLLVAGADEILLRKTIGPARAR